jgi:hypothetical protein
VVYCQNCPCLRTLRFTMRREISTLVSSKLFRLGCVLSLVVGQAAVAQPAPGAQTLALTPNDRIRIHVGPLRLEGLFLGWNGDDLRLRRNAGEHLSEQVFRWPLTRCCHDFVCGTRRRAELSTRTRPSARPVAPASSRWKSTTDGARARFHHRDVPRSTRGAPRPRCRNEADQ